MINIVRTIITLIYPFIAHHSKFFKFHSISKLIMSLAILLVIACIATVNAHCDNGCSGHGTCMTDDICKCHDNWGIGLGAQSGDCSDRICPHEIAWVDSPNQWGVFHEYSECAGRGLCNRDSGECECFDGYSGKACQRTTCPNDCSGHGTCEYIEDLGFAAVYADYSKFGFSVAPKKFVYYDWDSRKTRGCVCDATYGDVDCSKRLCERGTDPLDVRDDLTTAGKYQTQMIQFSFDEPFETICQYVDLTFALTYMSNTNETYTTIPIVMKCDDADLPELANDVQSALLHLPNGVIDGVVVEAGPTRGLQSIDLRITFKGCQVEGPQRLLTVVAYECSDGCTPKITGLPINTMYINRVSNSANISSIQSSDYNAYECSRRGKCDYGTGECSCFEGYGGASCNHQTMLM